MPTNPYFPHSSYAREQDLLEDIVLESIKIYGHSVRYLPRTIVREDSLFAEDTLSLFDDAVEMEMYVKSVEGFEGEGDLLSKFGLEIRDQITFTVARKRFDQARSEKITSENGYNIMLETANTTDPSRRFLSTSYTGDSLVLEGGEGYSITTNRPTEGDLIYFPLVGKIFEIKFVEHEPTFYQLGRLQTYDVRCEQWEYSSQRLETGNTEIDAIESRYSLDTLNWEITLEDGTGVLQFETGSSMLQEYRLEDVDPLANNEYFQSNDPVFDNNSVVDFSESNPFSEGRY